MQATTRAKSIGHIVNYNSPSQGAALCKGVYCSNIDVLVHQHRPPSSRRESILEGGQGRLDLTLDTISRASSEYKSTYNNWFGFGLCIVYLSRV